MAILWRQVRTSETNLTWSPVREAGGGGGFVVAWARFINTLIGGAK